uniref:EF-hand domain-containing protein n=1 Tax=Corethron hystrix TaxID=216773 RepID=A0A7S1BAV6_9STRA
MTLWVSSSLSSCLVLLHFKDFNGDRMIEYTEFLGAAIAACGTLKKEKIAEAFSRIDSNDSKQISVKDLQKILGDSFPVNDLKAMVNEVDKDGNGKISLGEFYNLFRSWSGTRDS